MTPETADGLRKRLDALAVEGSAIGFTMGSDPATGQLLRALAATKPAGRFLEIGTGTGIATAWLLAGMTDDSTLDSVDDDATVQAVARRHLDSDARVTFHMADAAAFLADPPRGRYDLVFADTWAGKYSHLDLALRLVEPGGIYFIDDLLPQPGWPDGHAEKVPVPINELEKQIEFLPARMDCASGLMMLVRMRG